jgi:hypothetical protein
MDKDTTAPAGGVEEKTAPGTEGQTPETESANTEAEATGQETEATDETQQDQEQTQEPDEVEFDFGGNKRRFPKSATVGDIAAEIDAFAKGLWGDYTKKSQTAAEERKALESERSVVQKLRNLTEQTQAKYAQGLHLRSELEQLSSIDTAALWQSDPDQARRVSDAISRKQAEFSRTVHQVAQLEREADVTQAQEIARVTEANRKIVLAAIPEFEQQFPALKDYVVKNYGVSPQDADNWELNPVAAMAMWKAMRFDQMQAEAAKAAKPKPALAKPVTPMPTKGSATPARKDLVRDADKMTAEEWQRERESQLRRRASR